MESCLNLAEAVSYQSLMAVVTAIDLEALEPQLNPEYRQALASASTALRYLSAFY